MVIQMVKIVILGSCKFAPYEILFVPNILDKELYEKDHEKAYLEATKVVYPAIDKSNEVWIYAPEGIGWHTLRDIKHAVRKGKRIRILVWIKGHEALVDLVDGKVVKVKVE